MNEELLKAILARGTKKTEFNYGILTADKYVKTVLDCVGSDLCYRFAATKDRSFNDILQKASRQLVHSNSDMVVQDVYGTKLTDVSDQNIELPKNTLMAFKHVLTSDREDRDKDIMLPSGAVIDPKHLLLWQHIPTLPIGKHLGVSEHTDEKISVLVAIVDMNELSHDSAVMVDNDMARFSQGFRALEFERRKDKEQEVTDSDLGFKITKYETMEDSMVSIPSNVDAETEEVILSLVEGGKLVSPLMKGYGKQIRNSRSVRVPVQIDVKVTTDVGGKNGEEERTSKDVDCGCGGKGKASTPKETDADKPKGKEEPDGEKIYIYSGMIKDSWEYIEQKLREKARDHLVANAVIVDERSWITVIATFADSAILCHEKWADEAYDRDYYRAGWEMKEDEPVYTTDFKEVKVEVETKIIDKIFDDLKGAKKGRRLSRETMKDLQEVRDDVDYLQTNENLTRGGIAVCKGCLGKLDAMLTKTEDIEDEDNKDSKTSVDIKEVMEMFLCKATAEDRKRMYDTLLALKIVEERKSATKEYQSVMGKV